MTTEEAKGYSETVDNIIATGCKEGYSLAVIGGEISALKLAATFMEKGKKVLFVDADYETGVFLGKYKIGKDLKGFMDYVLEDESPQGLVCVTNKEQLDIVFTGNAPKNADPKSDRILKLLEWFAQKYDMIIVQSDKNGHVAACCEGTVLMMDKTGYSEISSSIRVKEFDNRGCLVLGVVINEG
jgi:hypothetical protein